MEYVRKSGILAFPAGAVILTSGLVVNIIQCVLYVLYWKSDKNKFRRINQSIVTLNWSIFIWLAEWAGGLKLRLYGDHSAWDLVGKDRGLVILNHCSDIDWLIGWLVAERFQMLGGTKALMKDSAKYLPVIGWCWWFCEFIWLKRSWSADKDTLYSGFDSLLDYPIPYWLVLFPEGTRYTPKKHLESQNFAKEKNLPVLEHLLLPRSKGFCVAATEMNKGVESIYNATIVFRDGKVPTVLALISGEEFNVDCHLVRHDPNDLPKEEPELKKWLLDRWVEKDDLISKHKSKGNFEGEEYPVTLSSYPAVVSIFWLTIWFICTVWFLSWIVNSGRYYLLSFLVVSTVGLLLGLIKYSAADKSKVNKKQN